MHAPDCFEQVANWVTRLLLFIFGSSSNWFAVKLWEAHFSQFQFPLCKADIIIIMPAVEEYFEIWLGNICKTTLWSSEDRTDSTSELYTYIQTYTYNRIKKTKKKTPTSQEQTWKCKPEWCFFLPRKQHLLKIYSIDTEI